MVVISLRVSYLAALILSFKICHSLGETSFRVTQTSNESITIAWDDITTLVNFTLRLNSSEVYSDAGDAVSPHLLTGLQPGSLQHIRVDALHENDTQLVLLDLRTYTKPNPAENIEVQEQTTSSIVVTWQAPSRGNLWYYTVKLQEVTSSEKNVSKTDPRVTFTGLDAAGKYTVAIVTVVRDQSGEAATKVIYSRPAAPTGAQVAAYDTEMIVITWSAAANQNDVSFLVSYQVAGGTKTLTSCRLSGCALTMPMKSGQPVTVFVAAKISDVTSEEVTATGNTKPLPPGYMQVLSRSAETITVIGLLPVLSSVSEDVTVKVTPSPSYVPQHSVSGANYSIFIRGLSPGTRYTITVATMSGQEYSNSTEQTFYTRPTKPAAVTRQNTTTDTLTVAWSEPIGGVFTHYVISIRKMGSNTIIKTSKVPKNAPRLEKFEGLQPGQTYEVTLRTEISGVYSDKAESAFKTKPMKPQNVYVSLANINSLRISWEAPSAGSHTGYLAELVGVTTERRVDGESVEFTQLNAGTAYTCVIKAVSGDQTSDPAKNVFYTKPEHPKWLNKTGVRSSHMTVEWGRPEAGSYDGFRLTLLTNGQEAINVNLNRSETRYKFTSLEPATRYTVKVAAKADGVYSSQVDLVFTTRPRQPRNLRILDQDTRVLGFAWDAPDQRVSVDTYRYTVTKSDSSQQADYVESKDRYATSEGLTPGGTYVIKVRAVKSGVESDPTDGLRVALTPDHPATVHATNIGQTSIELQWTDPTGDFDGFVVELKLVDSVVNTTQTGRSTKTVEIQDLLPDHTYTAVIYAVSNNKRSSGAGISVTTKSLGTVTLEVQQKTTTSITVSWMQAMGEVTYYELKVTPKDGGQRTTEIQAGAPLQLEVKNLQPGKTYTFTISVVASETKGTGSSREITTKPSAVTSLNVETVKTDTLRVEWQVPADSIQQEFQVEYKLQSGSTTSDITVPYVAGQLTYMQDVGQLAPGHTYDITVSAVSHHVNSAPQTAHNTTRPLPVTHLQVDVLSARIATITWKGGETSLQDRFQVRYKGAMISTQWSSVQHVSDDMEMNVTDLTPGDRYMFEVTAFSIDQKSDPVTESATVYPMPPSSMAVVTSATTTSEVKVWWTYGYSERTYWTHWLVIYGQVGSAATQRQTLQDANLTTYMVDQLLAGYNYTIQVYTVTLDNVTSLSPAMVNATVKPDITTEMQETEEQTTTDTLAFSYTEEMGSGTFDHYIFRLQDNPNIRPVVKDRGDLERKVMFHGLEAGHRYWVEAQTVSGTEISTTKRLKIFTVPLRPEVSCVTGQNWISIVLSQDRGSASQFDVVCGSCDDSQHHTIPLDQHNIRLSNLQPFTEYKFDVRSLAGEETVKFSTVYSIRCSTTEGRPHSVEDFKGSNIQPYQLTLSWGAPQVTNGNLQKYVITYTGSKQFIKDKLQGKSEVAETVHSVTVDELKAGYTYMFEIRAYTGSSEPGYPALYNVTLPIWAPYIAVPNIMDAMPTVIENSVTTSSFKMEFLNPFSDKNGTIIGYSVVVTTNKHLKGLQMADLASWAHRKTGDDVLYVAIEKCRNLFIEGDTCWSSRRMKRSVDADRVVLTVGGDVDCDEDAIDPCNGKLAPDTTYYTMLRAYTEGNLFTNAPFSQAVTTADSPVNVAVIVVPIVICLILIIVVMVILVLRHRGTFSKKARPECPIFIGTLQQPAHRSKTDDSSRPIKLTDFPEHWKAMNADAQFKFAEEYEDLKEVGREQAILAAELPANRVKNRFSNILPYDNTRVRLLQGDEEEEGTDYINASWMPGYNSKREYIVTQGPLPSTRDDIWRVVWEQNVQAIVMLTKCVEKGRDKCDHYWPVDSEPMFYGDVQVMILNETKCTEWIVTEFKISSGGRSRNLKHFHYTAWPDFGVPDNPRSLIGFVRLVRSKLKTTEGPTIVHCSAGVGRSGTFIVLDRMLQHLQEHDYVDIFGTVYEMRKYRHWMVQTEQQYICSHRCLLYVIEGREFDDGDSDGEANKAFEVDEGIES